MPRSFERPRPYRAFVLGELTGVTYFCGTLYWLTDVMAIFGGISWPIAVLLALLLILYLALFPAIFSISLIYMRRRMGPVALLLAPAVWVATELGRGTLLTGFPWVPLGNSQVSVLPIAQTASLFGVYGLSALVALPAACVAYAITLSQQIGAPSRRRRVRQYGAIGGAAAVLAVLTLWGSARLRDNSLTQTGEAITVGIAQGNIAQNTKWNPLHAQRILNIYLQQSQQLADRGAKLIVWPEASMPFFFEEDAYNAGLIRDIARESQAFMLLGGDQRREGPRRYYNSAFLLRPDGVVAGTYQKMHLVPFGEYVPLKNMLFFVGTIIDAVGDFIPGEQVTVLPLDDKRSLSVAICYEAVFPGLSREGVRGGSRLLTTITNDAWYGTTSAPFQHFEQARMRAIEEGRYLVRSANTGISGVVDPYGRVVTRTNLFEPAIATADVRFLDAWTLYARIGDAFAYACVALTVLALIASGRGEIVRA